MSTSFSISTNVNTEAARKTISQAAHGFTVGTPVRRTSGSYVAAQADSLANSLCDGIVTLVPDSGSFELTSGGYTSGLSGLVDGSQYYLDPASSGTVTTTKTSTVGQFVKPLFKAISTTEAIILIGDSEEVQAAAGGGNSTLVDSDDVTNAASIVLTGMNSTYDVYELDIVYCIPLSAGANLEMYTSTNGGSTYAAGYRYVFDENTSVPGESNDANAGASLILLGTSVGATPAAGEEGVVGSFKIWNPAKATTYRHMTGYTAYVNTSSNFVSRRGFCYTADNAAMDTIKLQFSTGNITGKAYLRGYKNT